jgi:hypothetical protein
MHPALSRLGPAFATRLFRHTLRHVCLKTSDCGFAQENRVFPVYWTTPPPGFQPTFAPLILLLWVLGGLVS